MLENDILCGNYGINQYICKSSAGFGNKEKQAEYMFAGTPLSSGNISKPGKTLLIADSGYSVINWWHACNEPPVSLGNTVIEETAYVPGLWINKNRNFKPGQERDAIDGRHLGNTVNIGFVDGHVERENADDLFVEKTGEDDYKNISPLWVPGTK